MLYTLIQRIQNHGATSFAEKKAYKMGSYKTDGSSRVGKKVKKFHHPLSMPNDTAMDSDDRIIVEPKQESTQPSAATDGGPGAFDFNHGRDTRHDHGIRVQTDLHIESSDSAGQGLDRGNEYHQFPESRV